MGLAKLPIWKILATALSQFVLAYLTLSIQSIYPVWSSPFWPASGAALAACILGGPWMLLGVYLGLVFPNIALWEIHPNWMGYILPFGNVMETAMAWYLLKVFRKKFDFRFPRVTDVGMFLALAPWIPALISALYAQTCLLLIGSISKERYVGELLVYWLGNATGIMLVAPLILVWRDFSKFEWTRSKGRKLIFILALTTISLTVFHAGHLPNYIRMSSVLIVPLVAWGIWTTGFRGATLIALLGSFTYFVFDVPACRPISTLLKEKHLQANISFIGSLQIDSPINKNLPKPPLIEEALEQIGILTTLCLTILPLGAASDELRRRGEHDDLVMHALSASFWSWTSRDGLRILDPDISAKISSAPLLFHAHVPSGQMTVSAKDPSQLGYISHWAITERGKDNDPLVVTGILQSQSEAAKREIAEKRADLANLEIQALRAHLNPHLIFNCLTGLRALIRSNPELARDFTGRLARFLRAIVDSQASSMITLTHEIEICMDYINLESGRGKDIELIHQSSPLENSVFVPPLSVVTLLENAIKHGQTNNFKKLRIELIFQKNESNNSACIIVRHPGIITNNGKGGTPGGLSLLNQQLKAVHHPSSQVDLVATSTNMVEARLSLFSPTLTS